MDDYRSAAAGGRCVQAKRLTRFATFPPYLTVVIKRYGLGVVPVCCSGPSSSRMYALDTLVNATLSVRRYYVDSDWTPKKMEVEVPVPDTLDLESLRGGGLQPGETSQPEEAAAGASSTGAAAAAPAAAEQPDEAIVASLVSMGFSENGSMRAGAKRRRQWSNVVVVPCTIAQYVSYGHTHIDTRTPTQPSQRRTRALRPQRSGCSPTWKTRTSTTRCRSLALRPWSLVAAVQVSLI